MVEERSFDALPEYLHRLLKPIARGASNDEIAEQLSLSRHTVENYISEIMQLTGCPTRPKLMVAILQYLA